MSTTKTHLYVRIKCPYCKWHTTAAEPLGMHLVDKHPDKVIKGHVKIRTGLSKGKKKR